MKNNILMLIFLLIATITSAQTNTFPSTGNVGIGTTTPLGKLHLRGDILLQSSGNNNTPRPILTTSRINGEIRAYSGAGINYDDGLLRLSAGGGTNTWVMSYIDISGYSTIPDMDRNIVLGTAGQEQLRINGSGNVGIGTCTPKEKLSVNGKIRAKEIKVEATNWPDYVFEAGYKVGTLEELESYIKANKHLPGMPSAIEAETNGIQLGETLKQLLKNQEVLTLLLIEQKKEIERMNKQIEQQKENR